MGLGGAGGGVGGVAGAGCAETPADVPDLTFEHYLARDVDDLSLLMESRRLRPRQGQSGSA